MGITMPAFNQVWIQTKTHQDLDPMCITSSEGLPGFFDRPRRIVSLAATANMTLCKVLQLNRRTVSGAGVH
jgi:hypothetical protein